jgi:hypothetical protein
MAQIIAWRIAANIEKFEPGTGTIMRCARADALRRRAAQKPGCQACESSQTKFIDCRVGTQDYFL